MAIYLTDLGWPKTLGKSFRQSESILNEVLCHTTKMSAKITFFKLTKSFRTKSIAFSKNQNDIDFDEAVEPPVESAIKTK